MRYVRSFGALILTIGLASCLLPTTENPGTSHVYSCPVGQAWAVVERTLAELDYRSVDDRHDSGGGIVHAIRNDAGQITVSAFPYLLEGTSIVWVATPNGNREVEDELFARIDAHLRPAAGRSVPTSFRRSRGSTGGAIEGLPWIADAGRGR